MKYLLVLVVVGVLIWVLTARRRSRPRPPASADSRGNGGRNNSANRGDSKSSPPAAMLACAHCGLLLPPDEAVNDAAGRVFCSEAHRLAGPL